MNTVRKLNPTETEGRLKNSLGRVAISLHQRRLEVLASFQVSETECDIIAFLAENETKKMKEVGEHFGIKLSTLTSTIDKLENLRLVKRKNSREDRRVIFIQTTSRGKELLERLDKIYDKAAQTLAQSLSAEQIDAVVLAMSKI